MEPMLPQDETVGRRRRRLFQRRQIPVRMLVPNFFTLLSLFAGLTAIRMAFEARYELAVMFVVAAALLDAVDGRAARWLQAQSRFGAELDSLADFVNFGVAPALLVYTWGLGGLKGFGWVTVMVFASAMALRLARFNSMLDVEKPKWKNNYFTGMPAPAGAITVLLPIYLQLAGLVSLQAMPALIAAYTLFLAFLLVSTIPTFSGKNLGGPIRREYVLPILVGVGLVMALLVTYPYETLALATVAYLSMIPFSYRQFARQSVDDDRTRKADEHAAAVAGTANVVEIRTPDSSQR